MYVYIYIRYLPRCVKICQTSDFLCLVLSSLVSPKPAMTSAVNFEIASSVMLQHSLASIHFCQAKLKDKMIN